MFREKIKPASFILASASPRRKHLLESLGLCFDVEPSTADETSLLGEKPEDYVYRVAAEKAHEVASRHHLLGDLRPVLAADTIVVMDGLIIGKPSDRADAQGMLERLSGRQHQVITGFCVIGAKGKEDLGQVTTAVRFKTLSPQEISAYLTTNEWQDKAGAYAVQGRAAYMVKEVWGSYTNVVGLPLCEVVELLQPYLFLFHELENV